jgi:hypothetical protein
MSWRNARDDITTYHDQVCQVYPTKVMTVVKCGSSRYRCLRIARTSLSRTNR